MAAALPTRSAATPIATRIRRATVADAERLMTFGRQAFDDTFSGHPKNAPHDMALYMDEAFTVPAFEAEIGNYHLQAPEGAKAEIYKNVFLMMERIPEEENTDEGGKELEIIAYAKLCCDAIEEGITVGPLPTTSTTTVAEGEGDQPQSQPHPQRQQQRPLELGRLYVKKSYVGTGGYGSALLAECERVAVEEEGYVRGDVVWLGVWEDNFPAQRFYERKGFRFVGQHVFQLGTDPQIDLLMQREL